MTETLETIQSFWSTEQAYLARNRLESHGIRTFLNDESVNMLGMYANAAGGVKLLVKGSDAERAAEILEEEPTDNELRLVDEGESGSNDTPLQSDHPDEAPDGESEEESVDRPGTLTTLRAIRRPIVWLFFAPIAVGLFFACVEILNFLNLAVWNLWIGN